MAESLTDLSLEFWALDQDEESKRQYDEIIKAVGCDVWGCQISIWRDPLDRDFCVRHNADTHKFSVILSLEARRVWNPQKHKVYRNFWPGLYEYLKSQPPHNRE